MKKLFFIVILFISSLSATAKHVAGGELFYQYMGAGPNGTSMYKITLRLFRDCLSNGPLLESETVVVGIFASDTYSLVQALPLDRLGAVQTISLNTAAFPCLTGMTTPVCYQVAIFSATVALPDNNAGYTLSRTGCCRVDRIDNLVVQMSVGSNYVTKIPGRSTLPEGHNSSPQFYVRDTVLVCTNKKFKLDFGAQDPDGDSLTYSLCDAYTAPNSGVSQAPTPTLNLIPLQYIPPYSGSFPLGPSVTINPSTGIISGIAPASGHQFVVNVCVTEWRNGVAFTEHRKDFILKIQDCDLIEAALPDKIIQCKIPLVHFENLSSSSGITSYLWEFGDNNTSTSPTVDHTYADTGTFMARLTVTGPKGCIGSDSTLVLVYPGFTPGFAVTGSCVLNPFHFKDTTVSKYGTVNSWFWNFGDQNTNADTSIIQNPTYKYLSASQKTVSLIVTNTKGCIDTAQLDYPVRDKPVLQLPFKDTLICNIDSLPIHVGNPGVYSWLPNKNILFPNTSSPVVFPKDTTQYIVSLNDSGCINTDTVTVNVLPFIKVKLENDSVICKSDIIQLRPVSYALQYAWTSSSGEIVAGVKYPLVQPLVNTKYYVKANLGKCEDHDSVMINVVPYPVAVVGPDTTICLGSRIQLRSTVVGSSVTWSPANSLINPTSLTPVAGPSKSTAYILRVTDTLGCPKPASDTILVAVAPKIIADAGRDTVALPDQPIQLIATGGLTYSWSPEIGLNDPSIYDPIATLGADIDSIKYRVRVTDAYGCYADDDIVIRVYKTGPDIIVPSAFTPNGDGKNDILKPIMVGISTLAYFKVFNRWGQLMFSTTQIGKGWDGIFNGVPQPSNTYVYETLGADYKGKTIFRKGTVVLIR